MLRGLLFLSLVLVLVGCADFMARVHRVMDDDPVYVAEMNDLMAQFKEETGKDLCVFETYQATGIFPSSCIFVNKIPFVIVRVPTNVLDSTTLVSYTENSFDGPIYFVFDGSFATKVQDSKYPPFFAYDGVNAAYFTPASRETVPLASFHQVTTEHRLHYERLIAYVFKNYRP